MTKKVTLPILRHVDEYTPATFAETEKVTCQQDETKSWIWLDDDGNEYFKTKCNHRYCFSKIGG